MKKYLSIIAATVMAASAYGQGTVAFQNNGTSTVKIGTSSSDPAAVGAPITVTFVELLWATSGTAYTPWDTSQNLSQWLAANPGWSAISASIKSVSPTPGRFNGGTISATPLNPAGDVIRAVVAGWTGGFASFDQAYASGTAFVGLSGLFTVDTGDPTTTPAGTPGALTGTGGYTGQVLVQVPEPTSFALAGLGAAALLIFRRRK
jgi:hypothetical protein